MNIEKSTNHIDNINGENHICFLFNLACAIIFIKNLYIFLYLVFVNIKKIFSYSNSTNL